MSSLLVFAIAAVLEIAGCFAFWSWLRSDRGAGVALLGTVSLIGFAVALTRADAAFAGRAYAAYGGIYIVSSLIWLAVVLLRSRADPAVVGETTTAQRKISVS